jgi:hypothetical protein
MPGVTVTLSGASKGTTTTDGSGKYLFAGLANGGYTVTARETGFTFTPASAPVTINGVSVTGQNFAGTLAPTYSIGGTVTSGGIPLSDVLVTLSGAGSGTALTDAGRQLRICRAG